MHSAAREETDIIKEDKNFPAYGEYDPNLLDCDFLAAFENSDELDIAGKSAATTLISNDNVAIISSAIEDFY